MKKPRQKYRSDGKSSGTFKNRGKSGKYTSKGRFSSNDYAPKRAKGKARPNAYAAKSGGSDSRRVEYVAEHEKYSDVVLGKNAVYESLIAGAEANKLIVLNDSKDHTIQRIIDHCKEKQVPIDFVDRAYLDLKYREVRHGGVVLYTTPYAYLEVDDLLALAKERGEDPFLLVLDGIEDPHNLGAIIRTAEAAGVHGLIIPKRGCAPVNDTAIRTSSGAAQHLRVARVANLVSTMEELKKAGLWIVGAAPEGQSAYTEFNLKGALAIVIGSEGTGMSRLVEEHCDAVLTIPMHGKTSSLNASVAAGIMMFEALRQRG